MKTLTWKDFEKHRPSYDLEKAYGPFEGTILDLMDRADIPPDDRVWAFTRSGIVPFKSQVAFGILCAKEVCNDGKWNKWADRWLSGKDRSMMAAKAAKDAKLRSRIMASRLVGWDMSRASAWAAEQSAESAASASEIKEKLLIAENLAKDWIDEDSHKWATDAANMWAYGLLSESRMAARSAMVISKLNLHRISTEALKY